MNYFTMRECWNRQTGAFEGRVKRFVWVQVPSLAPCWITIRDLVFLWLSFFEECNCFKQISLIKDQSHQFDWWLYYLKLYCFINLQHNFQLYIFRKLSQYLSILFVHISFFHIFLSHCSI